MKVILRFPAPRLIGSRIFFALSALFCCSIASAETVSTDLTLAADATTLKPANPLRKGDRVFVQSPHLEGNEVLLLVQCLDGCATTKIIRAWRGHNTSGARGELIESAPILEDGDYYFAANEIPRSLPSLNFHGCIRSLPLKKLCSDARPLKITETKAEAKWFRARLSSGNWIWIRSVRR